MLSKRKQSDGKTKNEPYNINFNFNVSDLKKITLALEKLESEFAQSSSKGFSRKHLPAQTIQLLILLSL